MTTPRLPAAIVALALALPGAHGRSGRSIPLALHSEEELAQAKAHHPWLMVMVHSEFDPGSQMAGAAFRHAAKVLGKNVTFASILHEEVPDAAYRAGGERSESPAVPAYGLWVRGMDPAVPYRGEAPPRCAAPSRRHVVDGRGGGRAPYRSGNGARACLRAV